MEFHQLRYFCAVAQTGSFTKAAQQLGLAQPSLSEQVARLEESMGTKLFDRLGRGVHLTEAGKALLPQAKEILRNIQEAKATVSSFGRGVTGRLVVGCIPTITPYFLAPRLREFAEQYPEVEIRLVEDVTTGLIQQLQTGEMDVALISPPVGNPDVVCSDLFREPIFVAVGHGHKLANNQTIRVPDLQGEKLLLLKEGHCFRDNALTICTRGHMLLAPAFETHQFSSILPLVAAGYGVSLVPSMAVDHNCGCRFLRLERDAYRRVGYMRIRRHVLGTAQKAFLQWLRNIAKERIPSTSSSSPKAQPAV